MVDPSAENYMVTYWNYDNLFMYRYICMVITRVKVRHPAMELIFETMPSYWIYYTFQISVLLTKKIKMSVQVYGCICFSLSIILLRKEFECWRWVKLNVLKSRLNYIFFMRVEMYNFIVVSVSIFMGFRMT